MLLYVAGEAIRLQQLEVRLLGESSTGFKNSEAAQPSPGNCVAHHEPPCLIIGHFKGKCGELSCCCIAQVDRKLCTQSDQTLVWMLNLCTQVGHLAGLPGEMPLNPALQP